MTDAALGIGIGGLVSAAGNYMGAQATAKANTQAANLQQQRYEENKALMTPYISSGTNALAAYNTNLGLGANGAAGANNAVNSAAAAPGFQQSVNYGLNQTQAASAAQGMNLSGNTLAALQNYSQQNLYGAYQTNLQNLFKEANLGEAAGASLSGVGSTMANNQGNFTSAAGASVGTGLSQLGNSSNTTLNALNSYYAKNPSSS